MTFRTTTTKRVLFSLAMLYVAVSMVCGAFSSAGQGDVSLELRDILKDVRRLLIAERIDTRSFGVAGIEDTLRIWRQLDNGEDLERMRQLLSLTKKEENPRSDCFCEPISVQIFLNREHKPLLIAETKSSGRVDIYRINGTCENSRIHGEIAFLVSGINKEYVKIVLGIARATAAGNRRIEIEEQGLAKALGEYRKLEEWLDRW